jgi:Tfp pilus assembly protein FimT
VVVLVGTILLGLAIPAVQSALRHHALNSAAANITRITQLARHRAISQGSNACVLLNGGLFGLDGNCNGTLDANEQAVNLAAGVSLTDTGPGSTDGMNFSSAPTAVSSPFVITFNPRGNTTVSPTVSVVYLTGWTLFRAVTVTGSGRARTWQYNGSAWR